MAYFQPIDPKGNSIRVLTLLPKEHNGSSQIQCELENKTWASKPEYEAVSHAWGPGQATKSIFVNKQEVQVRPRLYNALCSFQTSHRRPLWVDALCINMEDKQERVDQVNMMSYIYSRAKRVLAYLGQPKTRFTQTDLDEMEKRFCYFDQKDIEIVTKSSYWTRRWTIQELILAKEIRFHLGEGFFTLEYRRNSLRDSIPSSLEDHFKRIEANGEHLHSHLQQLETLIEMFKELDCENLHDRIFSFIGIADDAAQALIEVDYEMNFFELYARLMDYHQAADVLQCRSNLFRSSSYDPEPWVETWRGFAHNIERSVRVIAFSHLVQITLKGVVNQTPIPSSLSFGDPITARGVLVSEVLYVGGTYDEYVSSWDSNKKWQMALEVTYKNERDIVQLRKSDASFSRKILKWSESELEAIQNCDTIASYGYREDADDFPISRDDSDPNELGTEPRRFLGSNGLMGFLPSGARKGDEIYSFWESLVGIVVRQVAEDRWMIVGRTTLSKDSLKPIVAQTFYKDALKYDTTDTSYHGSIGKNSEHYDTAKVVAYTSQLKFKLDIPTLQRLTA